MWLLRILGLLLVGVVGASGASLPIGELKRARAQTGVQFVLEQEESAWRGDKRRPFGERIDEQVSSYWKREWSRVWDLSAAERQELSASVLSVQPLDNLVMVQVRVDGPAVERWRSSPYRETRFYRKEGLDWIRTLPEEPFWGDNRAHETRHLRFEYRDREAAAVEAIAGQMDQLYLDLHEWLGLAVPPRERKLTFVLVPHLSGRWPAVGLVQEVGSPVLARIPADLTDDEFLAHMIASRMVSLIVDAAYQRLGDTRMSGWDTMIWALNGYLRTELLGQRSPWHLQADTHFRTKIAERLPLTLPDVEGSGLFEALDQQQLMVEYALHESIVAYALTTYGEDRLPELLQGYAEHLSWEELVTDVYGVSLDEFELGWNRYLTDGLGVAIARQSAPELPPLQ